MDLFLVSENLEQILKNTKTKKVPFFWQNRPEIWAVLVFDD